MKILLINGPNLNALGRRDPSQYGTKTLSDIEGLVKKRAGELEVEVECYQSNSEGALIDYLQQHSPGANGIVINPGALTHYGLSLRDALEDTRLPIIEVHLSNIYSREEFRRHSVISPITRGQVTGLGWRGYLIALETLQQIIKEQV